jgi:hypothetical protein
MTMIEPKLLEVTDGATVREAGFSTGRRATASAAWIRVTVFCWFSSSPVFPGCTTGRRPRSATVASCGSIDSCPLSART